MGLVRLPLLEQMLYRNGQSLAPFAYATKGYCKSSVPVEHHLLQHSPPPWNVAQNRFQMVPIGPDSPEVLRQSAKEYMLKAFYQEAPIPRALGLDTRLNLGCRSTFDYLDKEMNAHLDSGVSTVICDNEDMNKIVGCGFSKIWSRNSEYRPIYDVDVKSWHNMAAENATQKDGIEGILEWRSSQSQHIYNLGQMLLAQSTKKFALYLAMLHISPCAQSSGLSSRIILKTMMQEMDISNCLIYLQSNFPGFEKSVYSVLPNPQLVDQVKYKDEELCINGNRCFKKIEHLDGLKFFVEFFHPESCSKL